MKAYMTRRNDEEECWELLEAGGATEGGDTEPVEHAVLARFYDGNANGSPLADLLAGHLNDMEFITGLFGG